MILRDYQKEAYDNILEAFKTYDTALCVMATATGKTIVASHIINHYRDYGRIMVVAHHEELITQAQGKIKKICGVDADVEMGAQWASKNEWFKVDVVVSTIQTQIAGREGGRMIQFNPDDFSLLITDEGHHAVSDSWTKVIDYYRQNPKLKVLGLTATPDRLDKKALGRIFQTTPYEYDIEDGIEDGWLVHIEGQSIFITGLDYSHIKTTSTGDLNGKDLAEVLEYEEMPHKFADAIMQSVGDKKTLVFAASVAHAERMAEIFNRPNRKPGSANFVSGETPKEIRQQIVKDFFDNKFQYLINVGCFLEGFDDPSIKVIADAAPTLSRSRFTQKLGRGTRVLTEINIDQYETAEQRRDAIARSDKPCIECLDFVGNAGKHKLICPADILGGKYPDEVVELAKESATKKSIETKKPVDIASELVQAEREIAHRAAMRADAEIRNPVLLRTKFSTAKFNPFDIFDINPVLVERPQDKGRAITKGQKEYLEKYGVNCDGLDKTHAGQIINEMISRREKGICTFKQAKCLRSRGLNTNNMTFEEANKLITELVRNRWITPKKWFKKATV